MLGRFVGDCPDTCAMALLWFDVSGFADTRTVAVSPIKHQLTCTVFSTSLFLVFFPRRFDDDNIASSAGSSLPESGDPTVDELTHVPTWKEAIIVMYSCIAFGFFCAITSAVFIFGYTSHLRAWANAIGSLGAVLAGIQYLPQIVTTWRRQSIGSLSVPMMCIQTPGSFVFAASLAARLGAKGWSAWGLFILTGCLQGCLLFMSLGFMWRDRRAKSSNKSDNAPSHSDDDAAGPDDGAHAPSERTPLLAGQDETVGH
jgi:hypothetical protein